MMYYVLKRRLRTLHLKVVVLSSLGTPIVPQRSDGRVWVMV